MKTKKAISLALFLAGVLMISSSMAAIAVAADNVTVNVSVPRSGTITLQTKDATGTVHTGAPFSANFDSIVNVGSTTTNTAAVEATVTTNSNAWTLSQAISSGSLRNVPDAASINLAYSSGGAYANMNDVTGENIVVGGAPTAGSASRLDYRINVAWTDPDGTYAGTVTYTFTPN